MVKLVLVVTTVRGFGETLRQTLQETGRYQVSIAIGADDALTYARAIAFRVAILDGDTLKDTTAPLAGDLVTVLPNIRLVLIPPKNDLKDPLLEKIRPHGYLTKPFYAPDLLDTVDEVLASAPAGQVPPPAVPSRPPASPPRAPAPVTPPPPWLEDVNRAAQHLTLLSLESSAQAALLVHAGQLWAYAGQLPRDAAEELVRVLVGYWASDASTNNQGDLARFVHLQVTNRDYMLYATGVGGDMALALAFDMATPFSKIRSQAVALARSLARPPASLEPPASPPSLPGPSVEIAAPLPAPPSAPPKAIPPPREQLPPEEEPLPEDAEGEDGPPLDLSLMPLLDDVPPPNPHRSPGGKNIPPAPIPPPAVAPLPLETPVAVDEYGAADETLDQALEEDDGEIETTSPLDVPALSLPDPLPPDVPAVHSPLRLDWDEPPLRFEERPLPSGSPLEGAASHPASGQPLRLDPVTPALAGLHYACLLIPRLPHHRLIGDLAERMKEWMEQICLAFNWRLDMLSLSSEYLQWVVSVPPTTSPSYLMRVMRQQTSLRIFGDFPTMGRENPSGDFWAPGYLIMSSNQPPPAQVVKDFIQQTRNYQGATRPRGI